MGSVDLKRLKSRAWRPTGIPGRGLVAPYGFGSHDDCARARSHCRRCWLPDRRLQEASRPGRSAGLLPGAHRDRGDRDHSTRKTLRRRTSQVDIDLAAWTDRPWLRTRWWTSRVWAWPSRVADIGPPSGPRGRFWVSSTRAPRPTWCRCHQCRVDRVRERCVLGERRRAQRESRRRRELAEAGLAPVGARRPVLRRAVDEQVGRGHARLRRRRDRRAHRRARGDDQRVERLGDDDSRVDIVRALGRWS